MTQQDDQLARKASDRYWSTDESVSQLAEDLGISKGRLYDVILPLGLEGGCPECGGGPVGYANRTARDRDEATCPYCGWEGKAAELASGDPLQPAGGSGPAVHSPHPAQGLMPTTMLGGALLGLAVGLLIGRWSRS
ncbi:MAG: hypothetical protein WD960_16260 [Gemmatimonadota bacterium]